MGLPVKKNREIVFHFLYSRAFESSDWEEVAALIMRQFLVPRSVARAAKEKAEAVWQHNDELEKKIADKSNDYDFGRIPRIEQTILRLGAYELLHSDLPPKVAISEAVRIARKFATAEGATFVNAILDGIYKDMLKESLNKDDEDASISTQQTAQ